MNIDRALDFVDFVTERHLIWERRQAGEPGPWTTNPILASKKFTNVFRVLDFGSQFVLTDLLDDEVKPQDFLLRCFLYRHTGRVEAWQYLPLSVGEYPTSENLRETLEAFLEYRGEAKTVVKYPWRQGKAGGNAKQSLSYPRSVFTGAYLVYPGSSERGTDKLAYVFELAQRLVDNGSFLRLLWEDNQKSRFAALRENPGVADFMSMQILTDYGYSTDFREDEFVVPGPGAVKGAAALEMKPLDAIEWGYRTLRGPGIEVQGHRLSRMDIQNCLCEFSKYVRYQQKPSPQKPYQPAHPGVQLAPVLPAGWLNQ